MADACGVVLVDEKADAPHLFGSYGLPEGSRPACMTLTGPGHGHSA